MRSHWSPLSHAVQLSQVPSDCLVHCSSQICRIYCSVYLRFQGCQTASPVPCRIQRCPTVYVVRCRRQGAYLPSLCTAGVKLSNCLFCPLQMLNCPTTCFVHCRCQTAQRPVVCNCRCQNALSVLCSADVTMPYCLFCALQISEVPSLLPPCGRGARPLPSFTGVSPVPLTHSLYSSTLSQLASASYMSESGVRPSPFATPTSQVQVQALLMTMQ